MTAKGSNNVRKLVRWSIVSLKPGLDIDIPQREELISACMTESEFESWKIAEFFQKHRDVPSSYGRYLRVYSEVLRCYEKPAWDFEEEQIAVLDEIRGAIRGGDHKHRVRLPKTLRLAGPLNQDKSEFGDEFVNMPDFMGAFPAPGHTFLSGWVEVLFSEPKGNRADFVLNWFGVGTPVVITFGGGQQFDFTRTRTFPLPFLPNLTPVQTKGRLDLGTGKVVEGGLEIYATFQGTTIGRTDRVNRIPYAFPYIFPPLDPGKLGLVPPPDYRPPDPFPPVFGKLEFSYDFEGDITGIELHSETFAPVGLFPYIPNFFPPFTFGPNQQFHFANPDRCLPGTPPQSCPNQKDSPDGILTSVNVYFHPHIDLVSQELSEAPLQMDAPACTPGPVAEAAVVAAGGRLYQIGGMDEKGITDRVQVYDPGANRWEAGPPLPRAVASAQAAVVGRRIHVLGGWAGPGDKPVDAVQVLDVESGTWTTGKTKLPLAVAEGAAAAVGDRIYVVSGWAAREQGGREITPRVQILDTRSGEWRDGASASLPAVGASAVAFDHEILVVGGRLADNSVTRRTTVYDTRANQWNLGPNTLHGVFQATAGRLEGRILLVGGREKAEGPGLGMVQELDLAEHQWRTSLPQPLPAFASGGAVLDHTLYVVGGRTQPDTAEAPGALTQAVQAFRPAGGWQTCADLPVFTSASILNAAALGAKGEPYPLAPGAMAVLVGQNLFGPGAPPAVEVTVGGYKAPVIGFFPQPLFQALWFQIPPEVDPASGRTELRLTRPGSPQQAPPVQIPIAPAAPGIFVLNFGELFEPAFLDHAGALACNEDQTLNFASQPAQPGQVISLWATGLGRDPDKDEQIGNRIQALIGGKKADVVGVFPAPPLPPPLPPLAGVYLVQVRIPGKVQHASYVPAVLRSGANESNRAGVAIRGGGEIPPPEKPVPCAEPTALGAAFPFLLPPPPLPGG